MVIYSENPDRSKLNLIIRAYIDGFAYRYEFPDQSGPFVMKDEVAVKHV